MRGDGGLNPADALLDRSKHGGIEDAIAYCLMMASGSKLDRAAALVQARDMLEDAREQAELKRAAWAHRRGR